MSMFFRGKGRLSGYWLFKHEVSSKETWMERKGVVLTWPSKAQFSHADDPPHVRWGLARAGSQGARGESRS